MPFAENNMIETDSETFQKVVDRYATKKKESGLSHEDLYLDTEDNIIASILTSSWGAPTVYKVANSFGYENRGVINFIGALIKNKE